MRDSLWLSPNAGSVTFATRSWVEIRSTHLSVLLSPSGSSGRR